MPASKHYGFLTAAATQPDAAVSPDNAGRVSLFIQNTGANPGLLRFGNPCKVDGTDIAVAAGAAIQFNENSAIIRQSFWLYSALATTWAIVEAVNNG